MARRRGGVLGAVAIAAAGCASAPCPDPAPPPAPPAQAPAPAPEPEPDWVALERAAIDPTLPRCDEEPIAWDRACRMTGVYALNTIGSKKSSVLAVWPVVVAGHGGSALVGSLWFPETFPDPETLARYEGKRVEIAGVLRSEPAHKDPRYKQNLRAPTLLPVYAIRVLGDAP